MSRAPKHPPPRRREPEGEVLYGFNPVEAALAAGRRRFYRLLVKQGRPSPRLEKMLELARERGLSHQELSPEELDRKCGSTAHQGVGLACGALPRLEEKAALALGKQPQTLLVVLDEVQDPQNLGAVARSCAVFGAAGLVLPRHHSSPLSAAASKASAGLLEHLPVYVVANLARFLGASRKHGFWVAGASEDGDTPLHRFQRSGALVLVVGNEGRGLRPLVAQGCDYHLAIPTALGASLNVSAAAAVLLYHLTPRE